MSKSFTIANPNAEISRDQRSTIVKLLNSKAVVAADSFLDYDGSAVTFEDDSLVTFGDLMIVEAIDPAKPVAPGNRHYPVVSGLTKGQASGAIQALLEFPNKAKPAPAKPYNRNSAKPVAAAPQQDITSLVAETVMGVLGQLGLVDAPAKPEAPAKPKVAKPVPAEGHTKAAADPAKPVTVVPVELAEGEIVKIGEAAYSVTVGKNGRPYLAKVEA